MLSRRLQPGAREYRQPAKRSFHPSLQGAGGGPPCSDARRSLSNNRATPSRSEDERGRCQAGDRSFRVMRGRSSSLMLTCAVGRGAEGALYPHRCPGLLPGQAYSSRFDYSYRLGLSCCVSHRHNTTLPDSKCLSYMTNLIKPSDIQTDNLNVRWHFSLETKGFLQTKKSALAFRAQFRAQTLLRLCFHEARTSYNSFAS